MTTIRAQRLTIGTRASNLALWQTGYIAERLMSAWPELVVETHRMVTEGDKTLDRPLPEIGGKGLFTAELEDALRTGEIDLAVHSLKDLPVDDAPGLTLGAIVGRADVRDALVARGGLTLDALPSGAVVGTSSLRRGAQLLAVRPDLVIRSIRGNVETRIAKVQRGDYDAAVLATAGLDRLGLTDHVAEVLPLDVMLPAPGQGALAVQCRAADAATRRLLASIEDGDVRACVTAERAFLKALGGGCSAPIAAHAEPQSAGLLHLTGLVASPDGRQAIRLSLSGAEPEALGRELAETALARGARGLLDGHG